MEQKNTEGGRKVVVLGLKVCCLFDLVNALVVYAKPSMDTDSHLGPGAVRANGADIDT